MSKKEKKKNFIQRGLDKTREVSVKEMGFIVLVCLGIGATIAYVSYEAGALLMAIMIVLVISKILVEIFGE